MKKSFATIVGNDVGITVAVGCIDGLLDSVGNDDIEGGCVGNDDADGREDGQLSHDNIQFESM